MSDSNGWIKLHRKLLDNPIIMKDADHLAVWMYLLLNATHAEYPALFKGKKIILKAGQLITGRKSISEKLCVNESKVRRILDAFENDQQIDRQRSNQNTLISLVNWDKYQICNQQNSQQLTNSFGGNGTPLCENEPEIDQQNSQQEILGDAHKMGDCDVLDADTDQQNDQRMTNERPTDDQPVTTNKNVNNKKNVKNERNNINISSGNESSDQASPKPKPVKHKYGEYQHVLLSDKEFEKLGKDYGADLRDDAITFLDEYIEEKGYKSHSHNLAIRRWVVGAVQEKRTKYGQRKKQSNIDPSLDDLDGIF